jgi:hypothetical protein
MHLSEEHITSFQALYLKRFGKEISSKEAGEKGVKLLRLIMLIYRPMTQTEFEQTQQRTSFLLRAETTIKPPNQKIENS